MGNLEQVLERDVARNKVTRTASKAKAESETDEDDVPEDDEADALEPSPYTFLDQAYEDDADDDLMDLGVALGKMRIGERIGGYVRPHLAQEVSNEHGRPHARVCLICGILAQPVP